MKFPCQRSCSRPIFELDVTLDLKYIRVTFHLSMSNRSWVMVYGENRQTDGHTKWSHKEFWETVDNKQVRVLPYLLIIFLHVHRYYIDNWHTNSICRSRSGEEHGTHKAVGILSLSLFSICMYCTYYIIYVYRISSFLSYCVIVFCMHIMSDDDEYIRNSELNTLKRFK